MLKKISKKILDNLGYQTTKKNSSTNKISTKNAENFPQYLQEAEELGLDINDYLNKRWDDPVMILEKTVFPYLVNLTNPVVCEIGVGSGRFAREIAKKINDTKSIDNWTLHLVDHSPWIVNFLNQYFKNNRNIKPILNDGKAFAENDFIDILFSANTFIELKLGRFYTYGKEFRRVLKPRGYLVFDYIDIDSIEGWNLLIENSETLGDCFTYHSSDSVYKIFNSLKFNVIDRIQIGKSTYLIYQKA